MREIWARRLVMLTGLVVFALAMGFAAIHNLPVGANARAPRARQREASGISEVTQTSFGPMRSAIQSSALSAPSSTVIICT